jgi:hypothetical protein
MSLKGKIQEDLKEAIRNEEELKVLVLRQLSAAILNKEKEKRFKISKGKEDVSETDLGKESQLTDEEVIEVISSEAKKRKEAIGEFEKGERQDLVDKEKRELAVLQKYLPEQLSEEEIRQLAEKTIEKVGAKEIKDMGKVMAELMPKVKGKAEGAFVSKIVKDLLTS